MDNGRWTMDNECGNVIEAFKVERDMHMAVKNPDNLELSIVHCPLSIVHCQLKKEPLVPFLTILRRLPRLQGQRHRGGRRHHLHHPGPGLVCPGLLRYRHLLHSRHRRRQGQCL